MADEQEQARPDFKFKDRDFECLNRRVVETDPSAMDGVTRPADAAPRNVDEILLQNVERDKAIGWYHVEPGDDKARRLRTKIYWGTLVVIDVPLGAIAWYAGHTDPVPFVFALGGMAFFTSRLTWETWFLRTDL
jgi:hypothetical protein